MYSIIDQCTHLKEEYQKLLDKLGPMKEQKLSCRLRTSMRHGKCSYYIIDPSKDGPKGGRYISKEQIQIVENLAKYEYAKKLADEIESQQRIIDKALEKISYEKVADIYANLPPGKKALVNPYILTDEDYISNWKSIHYTPKGFAEGTPEIYSERGERVRSKSEKIIADKLYRLNIPYRYEAPLFLEGLGTIHPDFTVLDIKNRKNIYWEHLGMMDKPEYAEQAVVRINQYERNGYIQGQELILTYETSKCPLDIRSIEKIIERLL